MVHNKEAPVIGVSNPPEPSDDILLYLDLSDSDKNMKVLASGNRIKDVDRRKDILAASGDLVYQFEYRASGWLAGRYKVDSIRLDLTEEQAMAYFNAVQSVEIATVRRRLGCLLWMMITSGAIGTLGVLTAASYYG